MDVTKLIRDGEKVLSYLKENNDQLFTTKGCKVYFPKRYEEKGIAEIGSTIYSLGIVGIVVDDQYYATLSVITMVPFTPDEVRTLEIEGNTYYELTFRPGSRVISNMNCAKNDVLCYQVYDMFISKGRIPWYMSYDDLCGIFSTAKEYANASIGEQPESVAMCISLVARDHEDKRVYYRQVLDKPNAPKVPCWVPMKSVEYGATNTINKLGGSYFQTGVVSSLIDPSDHVENIESILRE